MPKKPRKLFSVAIHKITHLRRCHSADANEVDNDDYSNENIDEKNAIALKNMRLSSKYFIL